MAALRAEAMLDSKTVFALNSVSYLSNSGTGGPKCIPHEPDIISSTLYNRLPVMGSADDGSNGGSADTASTRVISLRAVKRELIFPVSIPTVSSFERRAFEIGLMTICIPRSLVPIAAFSFCTTFPFCHSNRGSLSLPPLNIWQPPTHAHTFPATTPSYWIFRQSASGEAYRSSWDAIRRPDLDSP